MSDVTIIKCVHGGFVVTEGGGDGYRLRELLFAGTAEEVLAFLTRRMTNSVFKAEEQPA